MSIPVHFNEPTSFLQRLSEDVEYSHILDSAADPSLARTPDRAALVAAFVISHYSSTSKRPTKPFNPLLGETFDFIDHQRNLAVVVEQVAHHPPISAIFAQGKGWTYNTAHEIKNRFLGNTLEVWPQGAVHIRFADGEHFVYDQAHTFVHNIVVGDLWIDNSGTITIREVTHGTTRTTIKLKSSTFLFGDAKELGDLSGKVVEMINGKSGKTLRKISGNWNTEARIDGRLVWSVTPRPPKAQLGGYNLTSWAWKLNAPVEEGTITLPKTDSRFRPDQRALEKGLYRFASSEKDRLEEIQRRRRKEHEENNYSYEPMWFECCYEPSTGKKEWRYKNTYFAAKHDASAPWPEAVDDIF